MPDRKSSNVDIPSPLHIIKKGKSMQVLRSSPRKISNESIDNGPDEPLTIVKNRKLHGRANTRNQQRGADNSLSRPGCGEQSRSVTMSTVASKAWDPVTPKPRKVPVSRRSSSLQVGRVSPTFLSKLRSLSNRRMLSSKTTHQKHDVRILSDATDESAFHSSDEYIETDSHDQSWNSGLSDLPSYACETETYNSSGNPFADVQILSGSTGDPYLLVPHVTITPESETLNDGRSSIWVAVEISGQLSHPCADNSTHGPVPPSANEAPLIPVRHCDTGLSRYGYLYNIEIDILPIAGGSVIDRIGDTLVRSLSPGSSILVLACIQLGPSDPRKSRSCQRDSDELIADLESQLGNARTEYVQVQVHYCHSGFPVFASRRAEDRISLHRTRLETTVTGAIKQHNPTSAWSPRPIATLNPLFSIIASHWGPSQANEPGAAPADGSEDTVTALDQIVAAPLVPNRQGSLKRATLESERSSDPARKIWTELRQTSSGNRPAFHVSKANHLPAATTFAEARKKAGSVSRPGSARPESKTEVQRRRELIQETAVRNRRSIGTDSLKSLVPSVGEMSIDSKENSGLTEPPSPPRKQESRLDGRKREGRWSLGNWW
ncbi:hypothetical protein M426DRAFT_7922 [Hypoxylon sp. CI-4A]|nr:hypothetical protein M426DRAFT_7922 [Hypoxylon sp. CI-4A]